MRIGTYSGTVYSSVAEEECYIIIEFFETPVWQPNYLQCQWPISSSKRSIQF